MTDITFIEVKSDLPEEKCEASEKDPLTETPGNSRLQKLSNEDACQVENFVPTDNCFHSIFGVDTPDWTKTTIKKEKDSEAENVRSNVDSIKNNLKHEVHVKKEGSVTSSSSCSSKQPPQTVPRDTKLFLSQTAYEQYQALLTAKIKCPQCFFTTGNRGNLKQHMKKHEKPPGYVYVCDICEFKTKYKNSMKGHAARHENRRSGSGRRKK